MINASTDESFMFWRVCVVIKKNKVQQARIKLMIKHNFFNEALLIIIMMAIAAINNQRKNNIMTADESAVEEAI